MARTIGVELVVTPLNDDLVAEEPCCLGAAVGYQSLGVGKFQFEVVSQEPAYPSLDFVGLVLWPRKAEQEVVGVPYVPETSETGIVRIKAWHCAEKRAYFRCFLCTACSPEIRDSVLNPLML